MVKLARLNALIMNKGTIMSDKKNRKSDIFQKLDYERKISNIINKILRFRYLNFQTLISSFPIPCFFIDSLKNLKIYSISSPPSLITFSVIHSRKFVPSLNRFSVMITFRKICINYTSSYEYLSTDVIVARKNNVFKNKKRERRNTI